MAEVDMVVQRVDALLLQTPASDLDFRSLQEDAKVVFLSADNYKSDTKQLLASAVECGHKVGARELEDSLVKLRGKRTELETHMTNYKQKLGIYVTTSLSKSDSKLPHFSGDLADCDYYTFRQEFEDYVADQALTKAGQLKLLQKTALVGTAKVACSNYADIEQVWDHLKKTWGNVTILFQYKVDKLRKLGRCYGSSHKQRDWAVNVKTEVDHLFSLATKHGLENEFYFSPVLQEIQNNLPQKLLVDFKDGLKKIKRENDVELSREVVGKHLIAYLDEVIENFTFEIDYEFSVTPTSTVKQVDGQVDGRPAYKPAQRTQNSGIGSKQNKKTFHAKNNSQSPPSGNKTTGSKNGGKATTAQNNTTRRNQPSKAKVTDCIICQEKHTHLYYCKSFQDATVQDRYDLVKDAKVCFRCLRLDSDLDITNRDQWWDDHAADCDNDWPCQQGGCAQRADKKQVHFLMCRFHTGLNKTNVESDFIKTLDKRFFTPTA